MNDTASPIPTDAFIAVTPDEYVNRARNLYATRGPEGDWSLTTDDTARYIASFDSWAAMIEHVEDNMPDNVSVDETELTTPTPTPAPIRTRWLKWRSIRPGAHAATDPVTHYTYTVERSTDGPGWDVYSHEFGTTHFRNNTTSYIEAKHDASRFAYEDHRTLMAERMAKHRERRAELVALAEAGDVHARTIVGTPIATAPTRALVLIGKVGPKFGSTFARVTSAGRTVQVQGQHDALTLALNAIAADYAEAVAS